MAIDQARAFVESYRQLESGWINNTALVVDPFDVFTEEDFQEAVDAMIFLLAVQMFLNHLRTVVNSKTAQPAGLQEGIDFLYRWINAYEETKKGAI